jgi:hypothetical protein
MQLDNLITAINAHHSLALTKGERYARGEQGAVAVWDEAGSPLVLKWSADAGAPARLQRAQFATDQLRVRGYPVPRYRLHGTIDGSTYSLQEMLPGRPVETVTLAHLPRLLALNAIQRGLAGSPASDWPRSIIESVLIGCEGYCVLASLAEYSSATRSLLNHLQTLVNEHADAVCPTDDIVHYDFNPANILLDGGQISGVFDWDGTTVGDRMFDLVTLLFYADADSDVRQSIWNRLRVSSTRSVTSLYIAHIIVRQLDWSIRHHDAGTVGRWLNTANVTINELATFTSAAR